jgi:hypothetical protein
MEKSFDILASARSVKKSREVIEIDQIVIEEVDDFKEQKIALDRQVVPQSQILNVFADVQNEMASEKKLNEALKKQDSFDPSISYIIKSNLIS